MIIQHHEFEEEVLVILLPSYVIVNHREAIRKLLVVIHVLGKEVEAAVFVDVEGHDEGALFACDFLDVAVIGRLPELATERPILSLIWVVHQECRIV